MDKVQIFNHYSKVIDQLMEGTNFFKAYFQHPWMLDYSVRGKENPLIAPSLQIHTGATRACIVDDDFDYVVKFDIEEDNYGSACEREVDIYNSAKASGMDRYFAEAEYLGLYQRKIRYYTFDAIDKCCYVYDFDEEGFNNDIEKNLNDLGEMETIMIQIPLYGYRRANGYTCPYASEEEIRSARSIKSPLSGRNAAVAVAFMREYGQTAFEQFTDFALEWEINDLHLNNIGEIDDHFVLIDYSGYHDGMEDDEWDD